MVGREELFERERHKEPVAGLALLRCTKNQEIAYARDAGTRSSNCHSRDAPHWISKFGSLVQNLSETGKCPNSYEITARYATIFQSFPAQLWLAQLDSDQQLPERRAEFTVRAFQYSTIVVFAFLLHERRFLTNDVWAILQAEHRQTVTSPWFVREWNVIKGQFEMYPNFIGYVECLQRRQSR